MFAHADSAIKALVVIINVPALFLITYLARLVTPLWRAASFLMAAPYLRVGSSVNLARMYGLLLLLAISAIILWERWRKKPTLSRLAAWAAVMVALLYTHGAGLLLLASFAVVTLLLGPRRWVFAGAACLVGLSLLPWVFAVLPGYKARGTAKEEFSWIEQNPHKAALQLPFFFLSGEVPGGGSVPNPLHDWPVSRPLMAAALVITAAIVFCAVVGRGLKDSRDSWLWLAGGIFVVPLFLLYLFSLFAAPAIHPRYLMVVVPAYWLLVVELTRLGGRLGRAILYGAVVPWVAVSIVLVAARNHADPPIRLNLNIVANNLRPSDLILCDRTMTAGWQVYWEWTRRLNKPDQVKVLPLFKTTTYNERIVPIQEMETLDLSQVRRVWFFYTPKEPPESVVQDLSARGFLPATRVGGIAANLEVFEKGSL
jgi:hypothetical protein